MGIFDFVKDAGAALFGGDDEPEIVTADSADASAQMNAIRGKSLAKQVRSLGLEVENLTVSIKAGTVTIGGVVADQATKEKVVLAVGNVGGVGRVDDRLTISDREPEAVFYTVKSGDSLSKIAKEQYGNAMKYPTIFEANKPMLTHPDKIYPGQVLRIPALEAEAAN